MKHVVNHLLHRWGYHLANLNFRRRDLFADANFAKVYAASKDYTTTPPEGLYAIYSIARYILANKVPGAFVDCAAWKGGGSIVAMETIVQTGVQDREIFAFDLFDQPDASGKHYWNAADFVAVKSNFYERGYPKEKIHPVPRRHAADDSNSGAKTDRVRANGCQPARSRQPSARHAPSKNRVRRMFVRHRLRLLPRRIGARDGGVSLHYQSPHWSIASIISAAIG